MSGTDQEREDDRDAEWLLARERGESVAPFDAGQRAVYERLIDSIRDLPTIAAPDDLPDRVLAAIDRGAGVEVAPRRAMRSWGVAVVATVAMAAGALLLVRRQGPESAPGMITTEVRRDGVARRGDGFAVGDVLTVRAQLLQRGELRIYRGEEMVARCPGDAACREDGRGVAINIKLDVPGRYRPVVFGGGVGAPSGRATDDFDAAMRARIDAHTVAPIEVW